MVRSLVAATVLLAVLAAPQARAQVNIDQDKTPSAIYESDCAVCHKSIHGLANGRGNSALEGFLAEHYTSSQQEAAALAAYVLAGGGGSGTPAPVHDSSTQPNQAAAEEPETHETRRPAKPQEAHAPGGKLRRQTERGKPARQERTATAEPGSAHGERNQRRPLPDRREPAAAPPPPQHSLPEPAEAAPPSPPPAPAQVAATPKPAELPKPEVSPAVSSPSAPTPETPPSGSSPAARDNIPD